MQVDQVVGAAAGGQKVSGWWYRDPNVQMASWTEICPSHRFEIWFREENGWKMEKRFMKMFAGWSDEPKFVFPGFSLLQLEMGIYLKFRFIDVRINSN